MTFELISDLHKDARGPCPSAEWLTAFMDTPESAQQDVWDSLCVTLDEREAVVRTAEAASLEAFENRIQGMMVDYSIDESTALAWDMEGAGVDLVLAVTQHGSAAQEIEHYLWDNGIAFSAMPRYVEIITGN